MGIIRYSRFASSAPLSNYGFSPLCGMLQQHEFICYWFWFSCEHLGYTAHQILPHDQYMNSLFARVQALISLRASTQVVGPCIWSDAGGLRFTFYEIVSTCDQVHCPKHTIINLIIVLEGLQKNSESVRVVQVLCYVDLCGRLRVVD
jgi:hypothetical protein